MPLSLAAKGFHPTAFTVQQKLPTQARTWYKSPAYREILHLRTDHGVGDVILIEGVGPDHTPGKFAQQIRDKFATGASEG
jgi:Domain of unknown function (DUF1330)